jgi:hypothetical protein
MNKSSNDLVVEVHKAVDPVTQEVIESFKYFLVYKSKEVESGELKTMFECEQEAAKLFGVNNYHVTIEYK